MIHDVDKPEISPTFTIEDIHKVREYHYETLKDATVQERLNFYNAGIDGVQVHNAVQSVN